MSVAETAPPIPCLFCHTPMRGTVLKLWGQFYYGCDNAECPIQGVDISMKPKNTPAGKFMALKTIGERQK